MSTFCVFTSLFYFAVFYFCIVHSFHYINSLEPLAVCKSERAENEHVLSLTESNLQASVTLLLSTLH